MTMGRAVAEAAFHRDVRHFAYPFGDRAAFARKHVQMAEEAGFASAASALPGVVHAEGRTNLHAMPRHCLGRTAALAARHAGAAVGRRLRAGGATRRCLGDPASTSS